MNDPNVAILGTGIMGSAMARNMRAAGLMVTAWNRSRDRVQPLAECGVRVAESPAHAAREADVVITMLSDGQAVSDAMSGPQGALHAMSAGSLWVQMSTIGTTWTANLHRSAQRAAVEFLDAPVLGTRQPAEEGRLTILASGDEALAVRTSRIFSSVGERVLWVGDVGASTRLKLVANQWSTGMVALLSETITLARALKVAPEAFLSLISGTPFSAPYAQAKGTLMIRGEFPPSFPLDMARKDVSLVLAAADQNGLQLPITSAIEKQYASAEQRGRGRDDLSAVISALVHD